MAVPVVRKTKLQNATLKAPGISYDMCHMNERLIIVIPGNGVARLYDDNLNPAEVRYETGVKSPMKYTFNVPNSQLNYVAQISNGKVIFATDNKKKLLIVKNVQDGANADEGRVEVTLNFLKDPRGLAVFPGGTIDDFRLAICDCVENCVFVIRFVNGIYDGGVPMVIGKGELASPNYVAVQQLGNEVRLVVTDLMRKALFVFHEQGAIRNTVYSCDGVDLDRPHGICIDRGGSIIFADSGNNRVVQLNPDCTFNRVLLNKDNAPDMNEPCGIMIKQETGEVMVGDAKCDIFTVQYREANENL
ncbi:unnamed protein product [Owenia fusiformis]|uniref:Uncharacterized protein n=1 Tax=Owenia fusiformis TaxID=6347 RepID=A0A8J1T559_OWEFU|nr:unnamed protein product [Owenia fusiformis]